MDLKLSESKAQFLFGVIFRRKEILHKNNFLGQRIHFSSVGPLARGQFLWK